MTDQRIEPLLSWLFSLSGPSLKWDIETARAFDARLAHPSHAFPSVHVAGTNGKGSVAAMVQAMAMECGLHVGLFTSPHLVRPEERIRIDRDDISRTRFRELILELRREAAAGLAEGSLPRHPSFFEMIAAAAFIHFREESVDLAAIETGLGGRLDATNVITPELSIITTIDLDHLKSLGGDITSIADEKAGIIKPGIPVIVGWIPELPLERLREAARQREAPFHSAVDELQTHVLETQDFDLVTPERSYRRLRTPLAGRHQVANAALAVRAMELLAARGLPIDAQRATEGLINTRWAGRLEAIDSGARFLLDAAHNAEGIQALAEHLREQDARKGRPAPRVLILGLSEGRQIETMLAPLAELVDAILLTQARTPKAIEVKRLEASARSFSKPVETPGHPAQAIERARRLASAHGEVLVTGSLYLVGDVRQILLHIEGALHRADERLPPLPHRTEPLP